MSGQQILPSISHILQAPQSQIETAAQLVNNLSCAASVVSSATTATNNINKRFISLPPLVPSCNNGGVIINPNTMTPKSRGQTPLNISLNVQNPIAIKANNSMIIKQQIPSPCPSAGIKSGNNMFSKYIENNNNTLRDSHMLNTPSPQQSISTTNSILTPSTPNVKSNINYHQNINNNTTNNNQNDLSNDVLTPLSAAAKVIITPCTNNKKRAFAFITHSQETFPKREPKIDNAPLARRKRRRTSTHELNILQNEFNLCPTPNKARRVDLANKCNMSEKAVQIWFQNKRQSVKRHNKLKIKSSDDSSEISTITTTSDTITTPLPEISSPNNNDTLKISTAVSPIKSIDLESNKENIINHSPISNNRSPHKTPRRSQALTFHLKSDMKILTPVKTSPNTRVNKLINGGRHIDIDIASTPTKKRGKILGDLQNRL